jgi:hypothetical protein
MITSIFSILNNNKKIALVISLAFLIVSCSGNASSRSNGSGGSGGSSASGRCQNPDDRASDGSRCGGRSSSSRPGGQ